MTQPFKTRRKAFLGAIQPSATPITLTGVHSGLGIKTGASTALTLVNNDRSDIARDTLSNISSVMGSKAASIEIEGELIGSGSVSTEPALDVLLRCSGLQKSIIKKVAVGSIAAPIERGVTLTGATSGKTARLVSQANIGDLFIYVVELTGAFSAIEDLEVDSVVVADTTAVGVAGGFEYRPCSSGMEWGTFSLWEDDYQKTVHSAMANISFNFESSLIASFSASILGPVTKDLTPDQWGDGTMPSISISSVLPPVMNAAKLSVSDKSGLNRVTSLVGQTATIDAGNAVALRRDMNDATGLKGSMISSRVPVNTIGVEYLTDAQYTVYDRLFANTASEVEFQLGNTAGNIIKFVGTLNFTDVSTGDENGNMTQVITSNLVDNTAVGDNEYAILFL